MRTLGFLLQKEFRQIFRNTAILRLILVMPVVQLLVIPLAADYEIKNINIAIVDHDRSAYSRQLVNDVLASGYFRLSGYTTSFDKSFSQFEKDESDLILEIPSDFERSMVRASGSDLFVAVNAINGVKASVGSAYLSQIIARFNADVRFEWAGGSAGNPVPAIEIASLNWYNPSLEYPRFMVPGILVVLVTMVGGFLSALNIVKEKEVGTIEQINVTPIAKHWFLLGKLIPFWLIGMFVFSLGLFGVAQLVYGIESEGSLWVLYGFLAVYLVALLGLGLLISTYSSTQQQAMSLAFFCMMIFILMSGLFTSVDSMPEWAQWISRLNPVTYFIEVMRMVVLKGSTFDDISEHFWTIVLFAVGFNAWAIANYKKR